MRKDPAIQGVGKKLLEQQFFWLRGCDAPSMSAERKPLICDRPAISPRCLPPSQQKNEGGKNLLYSRALSVKHP